MTIDHHIKQIVRKYNLINYNISEASVLLDPTSWEAKINIGNNAALLLSSSIIFLPDSIVAAASIYNPLQLIIDSGNNNVRMIEHFTFRNVSYHIHKAIPPTYTFPVNATSNIIIPVTGIVNIKLIKPVSSAIIRASVQYLTIT